jgi:PAS domain S-box-containing protein
MTSLPLASLSTTHTYPQETITIGPSPDLGLTLFTHSRDIILVVRYSDGKILEANPAAERAYGYSRSELLHATIGELRAPSTQAMLRNQMSRANTSGLLFETLHKRKDGMVFPVEVSSIGIDYRRDRANLSIIRDISERKQAEHALSESEERFRRLFEASPIGLYQFELFPNGELILASFNPAAERITKIENKDLIGMPVEAAFPSLKNTEILAIFKQVALNGGIYSNGQMNYQDDRFHGDYEIHAFQTGPSQMAVFFQDITDKKMAVEKISEQFSHLAALQAIDKSILASKDLDQMVNVLLEEITRSLDVDGANLFLYNPRLKILKNAGERGLPSDLFWTMGVPVDESLARDVASNQSIEFIADLHQHPFYRSERVNIISKIFQSYVGVPLEAKGELIGVLQLFHRTPLDPGEAWFDFLRALADQAAIAINNTQLFCEQQQTNARLTKAYDDTIDGWSRTLDLRDKETEGHSQRVTDNTLALAQRMNVSREELVHMRRGARLHDIGKMGIPDEILLKPGSLKPTEWAIMCQHPTFAADLLCQVDFLGPALEIPYGHHEKWDGSGYPQGLKGEDIPLSARIFAIVDVWDALTHDRPYRKAWPHEKALAYIRDQAGHHFDPCVTKEFLAMMEGE